MASSVVPCPSAPFSLNGDNTDGKTTIDHCCYRSEVLAHSSESQQFTPLAPVENLVAR